MSDQFELVNRADHGGMAMRRDPGIDHPHFVAITVSEVPQAAAVCPVFLAKNPQTGGFYLAALFGFEPNSVLVEGSRSWDGAFVPLEMQRQGFFTAEESIALDPGHPRFGTGAEVRLFDADGAPSAALRKIQAVLGQLVAGMAATEAFIAALSGMHLIEPVSIDLAFDDGARIELDGLYTVSRDRLDELADAEVVGLFRSGYLQTALAIAGSLHQVNVLARRRNLGFAG